jgi:cell division transport system ATP-binding protein
VSDGQILIDGMNLSRVSPTRLPYLRRRFGMVFQDFKLIPTRTVYDNVALALDVAGKKPAFIRKKVMHVLRITGMEEKARELPPTLSGGEQQRVALARAVAGDPDIILADEPTGSLDQVSARRVLEILLAYHKKGGTILVASHHLRQLESMVTGRSIVLEKGRLASDTRLDPYKV